MLCESFFYFICALMVFYTLKYCMSFKYYFLLLGISVVMDTLSVLFLCDFSFLQTMTRSNAS